MVYGIEAAIGMSDEEIHWVNSHRAHPVVQIFLNFFRIQSLGPDKGGMAMLGEALGEVRQAMKEEKGGGDKAS